MTRWKQTNTPNDGKFTLNPLLEKHKASDTRIARSQSMCSLNDPTDKIEELMIARNEGCGSRGVCVEAWKLILKPINKGAPSLTRISRSSNKE
ncbi:hypothetical protein Tco_0963403 [Tanacetum coccineum]